MAKNLRFLRTLRKSEGKPKPHQPRASRMLPATASSTQPAENPPNRSQTVANGSLTIHYPIENTNSILVLEGHLAHGGNVGATSALGKGLVGIVRTSILGRKPAKVPSKDGRSADAVLLRRTKAALSAHVGGKPSATQRALIDRAANLTLHVARMDARAMQDGGLSDHATREYLAWSNSLARTLALLGLDAVPAPPPRVPTVKEILAEQARTL